MSDVLEFFMKRKGFYIAVFLIMFLLISSLVKGRLFTDIRDSSSYDYQILSYLKENQIVDGYPDGYFRKHKEANRAEALKMILRGAGINTFGIKPATAGFRDVDKNQWYAKYVVKAIALRIIEGYKDRTFRPGNNVSLGEVLAMLARVENVHLSNVGQSPYVDVVKNNWYTKYFQFAKDLNLIDALKNGRVYPGRVVTRGDLAEIVYRYAYIKENGLASFPSREGEDQPEDKSDVEQEPQQEPDEQIIDEYRPPQEVDQSVDFQCLGYHPGFNGANFSCGEQVLAIDQLQQISDPRYKPGNTLQRLDYWVGNPYLAQYPHGVGSGGTEERIKKLRTDYLLELCQNWNYYLQISSNVSLVTEDNVINELYPLYHYIQLANEHLECPASVQTYWIQEPQSKIRNDNLGPEYYVRNASNANGEVVYAYYGCQSKCISPAAPTDIVREDAIFQRERLDLIGQRLTRPVDLVTENGEVEPYLYNYEVLRKDPRVQEDIKSDSHFKLPEKSDGSIDWDSSDIDWYGYQSKRKVDNFMNYYWSNIKSSQVFNKNTIFNWYEVAGWDTEGLPQNPTWGGRYYFDWTYTKQASDYSTPGIYPLKPTTWRDIVGWRQGWMAVSITRSFEVSEGVSTYWPFVAAGWNPDAARNFPPGQWLGFLKALVVSGAESFYPGYFHDFKDSEGAPIHAPVHEWVWQLAIPSYAQAIGSRAEDFLRNGELLAGDTENLLAKDKKGYEFFGGHKDYLIVVRKLGDKLLIAGTKQNEALQDIAIITNVDGISSLKFPVRMQGSVYIYDKSDQTLVQLDSWHKNSHPWYWPKKAHFFEAEVFDGEIGCGWQVKTDHDGNDYSNFVSYVESIDGCLSDSSLTYKFRVKKGQAGDYGVLIRARGVPDNSISVDLDGDAFNYNFKNPAGLILEEELIPDKDGWRYYTDQNVVKNLGEGWHEVKISGEEGGLQLDQVFVFSI